jgi:hypothetical protein
MIAIVEKEIRHPLAEILYKVAFERSQVVGTNYSFILLEKPKVQKEGISAKLLDKSKNKPIDILIGNKGILKNYEIALPEFVHNSEASTELYLTSNEEVLMVCFLLFRSSCSILIQISGQRQKMWSLS